MPLITWTEEYSVGIEEIDQQHKKLIRLTNGLYDAMKQGRGKDSLLLLLEELLEYTQYHFSIEEELFERYNYVAKEVHIKEHDHLKNKVQQLNVTIRTGKGVLTIEVFNFLKDWINHHILTVDRLYKDKLKDSWD